VSVTPAPSETSFGCYPFPLRQLVLTPLAADVTIPELDPADRRRLETLGCLNERSAL
jgi:hypothetical protein